LKFPEHIAVTPAKLEDLRRRIERLGIDLASIEERSTRGGGPGGQKRNKTSNAAVLHDPARNLTVRCGRDRRLSINRFLALRELVDRIEAIEAPQISRKLAEIVRIRRRKAERARRARGKH
jgi:protein subunit release factor B